MTITRLSGFESASPSPIDEARPIACLEVKKVLPVAQRIKLCRNRAHDRDDDIVFDVWIEDPQRLDSLHHASHINCRESSRATGVSDDSASVWASLICRSTSVGLVRWSYGIPSV